MKIVVGRIDYSFDPTNRKITFSDTYTGLRLARIGIITNVTAGILIYRFNSPTTNGSLIGLELTLGYDTTAMSASDELQIIVDIRHRPDPALGRVVDLLERLNETSGKILERLYEIR
jgi:hypothetical protein